MRGCQHLPLKAGMKKRLSLLAVSAKDWSVSQRLKAIRVNPS